MTRIYLDHAATTPLCREAKEAIAPWSTEEFGNPSSLHSEGRKARAAIDRAREQCSSAFGCLFGEFLFVGSGTESCNAALVGAALSAPTGRNRILFSAAEHHCVLHTKPYLERLGCRVDVLPTDRFGRLDLDALEATMGDDVLLISAMQANNETGAFNDIASVKVLAERWGALLHVDAVQTFPNVTLTDLGCDLASFSAHKLYGPKGVGGLFVRSGVKIAPFIVGGGQEREMRAGTENTAGIVGFGAATEAALKNSQWGEARKSARDAFQEELDRLAPASLQWTLPAGEGLSGHAHLRLAGLGAESALIRLDRAGISASSGAACSSGSLEPSHVLLACGWDMTAANEGLRFTFGKDNSVEEARRAASIVAEAGAEIRKTQGA